LRRNGPGWGCIHQSRKYARADCGSSNTLTRPRWITRIARRWFGPSRIHSGGKRITSELGCPCGDVVVSARSWRAAGRGQLLRTDPATWVGEFVDADNRATACACLRQYVFRRAGCREIRLSGSTRGEWDAPQGVALSPTLPVKRLDILQHVTNRDQPGTDLHGRQTVEHEGITGVGTVCT
jgi:hypothetical protein